MDAHSMHALAPIWGAESAKWPQISGLLTLPPAAPTIPLYCLSTIWASHIDVLGRACCTACEIFRDTNTNTAAQWGEWHLYGVLTPCKSFRLSLGTGVGACTRTQLQLAAFQLLEHQMGRFDVNHGHLMCLVLP